MDQSSELRRSRQWKVSCSFGWLLWFSLSLTTLANPNQLSFQPGNITPSHLTPSDKESRLLASEPVERELTSDETHTFRLTLTAGEYLRVAVEERGMNLVLTLVGPAGQMLAESSNFISRRELVSLIAETTGEFRLEVRLADKDATASRYEVKIAERRAATAQDRDQVAAERAYEAGQKLHAQKTPTAYHSALKKFEEALALQRAVGDRRGEAFAIFHLGLEYYYLNEWRQSLERYQQALPLVQMLGERKAEAWTLVEIGYAYDYLGEKQQALAFFNQALPLLRELGEQAYEGFTMASIALVYGSMGDREQALIYQQQALALRRSAGDRRGEASSLAAIGANYDYLGEKQKALEYLQQAIPLMHALGQSEGEAHNLYVLGLVYDSLNEREKAVECYNQSLTLRKAIGHRRGPAVLHHELGNIYEGLNDRQQALAHYQKSLALYTEAKDLRGVAALLRNIGLSYDALGEKQQAVVYFERALPLMRQGWNRFAEAETAAGLGKVLSELGEHQQALVHLNQALGLFRQLNSRFFETQALYWIARSERARGHLPEARARIEEALGKLEHLRRSLYQPDLRTTAFTKAHDFYELEIDLLIRLGESQSSESVSSQNLSGQNSIAAALEASERARARGLLDLLAEARIEIRQGISEPLKQCEQASQARLSAIQSQLIQINQQLRPDRRRIAALEEELKQADREREALECEIRRQHPRYAEILYPTPLRADAIRGLLDEQTALLEYTLGQEQSFLFVVTRDSITSFRLPKAAEISHLVEELRAALKSPGRREFNCYRRAAERLYQMLIAPASEALTGKQKLLIAPDGPLYYLPFEALLVKGSEAGSQADARELDYLLKHWAISYVPSASVLASLRRNIRPAADPSAKQFLAFADPIYRAGTQTELGRAGQKSALDAKTNNTVAQPVRGIFDGEARWELTRLAESQREVAEIARLYQPEQVALYLGSDAKEENVKGNSALTTARRIHFATHGLLSELKPQYSGLVLTLDGDVREDGLLQVYEIFNLKLQAELVVLSACQTGLGKEMRGEGVIGLTRAFLYAGVPSVAVSLWQVADHSTAELMVKFYRQLDCATDKAEALRQAKLEMMQNPRYGHPYYWAPFVLVGEPK